MFFDDLTSNEVEIVEQIGRARVYQKGDYVIQEGSVGSSFTLILSGSVEVRKNFANGKHKTLVELGPCDLVGEVGFLGVESRTASVIALSECEVMEFEREAFDRIIVQHSAIGLKVYRGMARELAQRLAKNDEELMDTIVWALGQTKSRTLDNDRDLPLHHRMRSIPSQRDSGAVDRSAHDVIV